MRSMPSVLHLDLDAFFAAVEQRDKPSLRGKPVIVGGVGVRGVVATASYEARVFGVRSAMPTHEARRRAPHAAFLAGRFAAYQAASEAVLTILRGITPAVEPLSLDEAFVDLAQTAPPVELSEAGLQRLGRSIKSAVATATGGLTASIGIGSSKFIAKLATELGKPDGLMIVAPGAEAELIAPLPVSVIPGVGPVTAERLQRIGVRTIAELREVTSVELAQVVGKSHAHDLAELAYARDNRPVTAERETKSISVEHTFETDQTSRDTLGQVCVRDSGKLADRLRRSGLHARTVTLKIRRPDFSIHTRSSTSQWPIAGPDEIAAIATRLLNGIDLTGGIRLLGVGVAGLTEAGQDHLFELSESGDPGGSIDPSALGELPPAQATEAGTVTPTEAPNESPPGLPVDQDPVPGILSRNQHWPAGADVEHATLGRGWVWGAGLGRVTVRFETWQTGPGPVHTFAADGPDLCAVAPLRYPFHGPDEQAQPT